MDHIVFASNSVTVMTTTNTYDLLNRRTGVVSATNNVPAASFTYACNSANQRTAVTNVDGSYWPYQYDALGQVTSGIKYWSDGTYVAGQQFDYTFDSIGNRLSTQTGGDAAGANLRTALYTNNLWNQVTSRDVPGYADVMGLTLAGNTVSVNGTNAYQRYEYFREQMGTNNSSAAQWLGINVSAPGQTTVSGHQFIAQEPETFAYDADGNLTNDGRWSYYWDGENRLTNMTSQTSAPNGSKFQLVFQYDYKGRRIQKLVSTYNGSAYVPEYTNGFAYDGWNQVVTLNPMAVLIGSAMWGIDLSGKMQGAGGVGGLLAENIVSNGVHFVAYDGNGNVAALVSATTGATTANYEYGPFGESIRASGSVAALNPVRFSTKSQDPETGLLYYGYRYYNPSTGKWPSRDPIEEQGGLNLYLFVDNSPPDQFDALGLTHGVANNFLSLLLGLYGEAVTSLGDNLMVQVYNSQEVAAFKTGAILEAKRRYKCSSSGQFILQDFSANFSLSQNWTFSLGSIFRNLGMLLTGNWQLYVRGDCKWSCAACQASCGRCVCHATCNISGVISKTYTFAPINANWLTDLLFYNPLFQETYNVSTPFSTAALDRSMSPCH